MIELAGADAYFTGTLKAEAWNIHADEEKQAALKDAERTLLALDLAGAPAQRLYFAAYEQAFCLLEMPDDAKEQQRNIALGLTSVTVDKHSETYGDASSIAGMVGGIFICPDALKWISDYLPRRKVRTGRLKWRGGRCGL